MDSLLRELIERKFDYQRLRKYPQWFEMDGYKYLSIPQRGNLLDARIRWGKDVGMAVSIPAEQDGRTIVREDIRI